jgi:hypothetical protein
MIGRMKRTLRYPFRAVRRLREPRRVPQGFESAVRGVLRPVEPSASFRESLRGNLALAVQRKAAGLVIEYPKPFREGVILGVSTGLLAAAIAAVVLFFRLRLCEAKR